MSAEIEAIRTEILADWPAGQPRPSGPEFDAYLGTVARLRDAQQRLEADGSIIADPKGNPIPHPALAIEKTCGERLQKWGRRFEPRR